MKEEKINGVNGWYFSPEEITEANINNKLLTIDFEFGDKCFLRCKYCYRSGDSRDGLVGLLNFDEWKKVIVDAKKLGLKSVKMIGGGEITEEDHFVEAMEYIASRDITIVLFTSGSTLGDEKRCKKFLGMNCDFFAKWMYDLGMTVFLKVDSFNPKLQDDLVGFRGYSIIRDRALERLLNMDFTKHNPTHLGLEVNVNSHNYHEILEIYSLRAKYNIYEDVVLSMPCEVYFKNIDYDISITQKKELYKKIYNFNKINNISFSGISPFIGGMICTQLANGLYITNRGHVFHCPGSFDKIGDIKNQSLIDIWSNFKDNKKYMNTYFCPFRENSGIIPSSLVKEIYDEMYISLCK